MNLMITLIPSFVPDVSRAKRVSFKQVEDIKDDTLVNIEREELKKHKREIHIYRIKLSRWRKDKVKAEKRVTRCQWFLDEAIKALGEIENGKPVCPAESKDSLVEIPVFTQPQRPATAQQGD